MLTQEEYRYLHCCIDMGVEALELTDEMNWVEHFSELALTLYERNQELQEFMIKA